jgi:hypothetical protein
MSSSRPVEEYYPSIRDGLLKKCCIRGIHLGTFSRTSAFCYQFHSPRPILQPASYRHLFLPCPSISDKREQNCQHQRDLSICLSFLWILIRPPVLFYSVYRVRRPCVRFNYYFNSNSTTAGSHRGLWTIMTKMAALIEQCSFTSPK